MSRLGPGRAILMALVALATTCTNDERGVSPSTAVLPDLEEARFGARSRPDTLRVHAMDVEVTTLRVAAKTRLRLQIRNDGAGVEEAMIRLPLPPGAAVTDATLWVADRPMKGAFVDRARAAEVYQTITGQNRDPALIEWDGEGWLRIAVYPVEPGQVRRLDLEWLEPLAVTDGRAWYRVPVIAERGRIVGQPRSLVVDGQPVAYHAPFTRLRIPSPPPLAFAPTAQSGQGVLLSVSERPAEPPKVVLLVDTSFGMSSTLPLTLERLLSSLPVEARVSLLAADWDTRILALSATPATTLGKLAALRAIHPAGRLHLPHALDVAAELAEREGAHQLVFVGRGANGTPANDLGPRRERALRQRLVLSAVAPAAHATGLRSLVASTGGRILVTGPGERGDVLGWGSLWTAPLARRSRPDIHPFFPLSTVTGQVHWLARVERDGCDGAARTEAAVLLPLLARAMAGQEGTLPAQVVAPGVSLLVLETGADYDRWGIPLPQAAGAVDRPDRQRSERRDPYAGAFKDAILQGRPLLSACYERALARAPGLAGRIEAELALWPSGRMTVAQWRSTLRQAHLDACLRTAIASWRIRWRAGAPANRIARTASLRFLPIVLSGRALVLTSSPEDRLGAAALIANKKIDLADRVRELTMLFEENAPQDPEALAWWAYARPGRNEGPQRLWFVASLLHALGKDTDAIRVLSELRCIREVPAVNELLATLPASDAVARLGHSCSPTELDEAKRSRARR